MVGMGIPLNIVSRIFKTPVLQEINESGQRADEKNIAKRIKEIEKYFENNPPSFPYLNSINTEMLDKIYVGEATEVEQKLHDLIVLQTMQKLNPLGSELFDFAKIYGSLRGLPNKKWQINDVIKTIEKYGIFKDEVNKVKTIQQGFSDYISEVFIEQSPEYKKLIEENKIEEAEQLVQDSTKEVKDDSILFGSKMALLRSNYINRVLRRSAARGLENNPGVSSFTNVIPLRLPHILASYRSLLQTQNILNKTFAVYNKTVTDFVEKIIRDANIFTEFNSSSSTELISKELIKFLSADMEFNLDNRLFSTLVPEDQKFYTASRTFEGKEA